MTDSSQELPLEDTSKADASNECTDNEVALKAVSLSDSDVVVGSEEPSEAKKCADDASSGENVTIEKHSKDPSTALDKLTDEQSGWGWSSLSTWGTSVLSTAATSVSTFKTQVGEGFHQVMETVESGLLESDTDDNVNESANKNSPTSGSGDEPTVVNQEMVRHGTSGQASEPSGEESETNEDGAAGGKDGWLSGWGLGGIPVLSDVVNKTSSIVQKTGSVVYQTVEKTTTASKKVISSGLDALETIGKKTYDALAEDDEDLTVETRKETRPTLSQTLREAKELADARAKEEEAFVESRKSNFGAQFDDFQGLVQLEALEGLFSTSESKVRGFVDMLPKDSADPLKSDLMTIKQIFDAVQDNDDEDAVEHDFGQLLTDYSNKLNINVSTVKIMTCQEKIRLWLSECESSLQKESANAKAAKEIHQVAIQSLAEMTSCATEHWRRVGQQLLLLESTPVSSLQSTAVELAGITKVLGAEIMLHAAQFVNCLTLRGRQDGDGSSTELITGVYLEASNASGYIRTGFRLLLPVLQLAIIKAHPLFKEAEKL